MNVRDFLLGVGATLLFTMFGASLYPQYRSLGALTNTESTAVQTAIDPLKEEMARLNNHLAQLSNSKQNAEFVAAVEKVAKPLNERIAALSKRFDDSKFVTRAELDAETEVLAQLSETNRSVVAAIASRQSGIIGNMDSTAEAAVQSAAAKNGYLRVTNNSSQSERIRVGSVMYRVPVGTTGIVVPAGNRDFIDYRDDEMGDAGRGRFVFGILPR